MKKELNIIKERLANKNLPLYLSMVILAIAIIVNTQSTQAVEAYDMEVNQDQAVIALDKESITYKVNSGDTLYSIAKNYSIDLDLVAAMNSMGVNDTLMVGQLLTLPNEQLVLHTVAAGDTLWGISRNYSIPVADIAEENNIVDTQLLRQGQTLIISKPVFMSASGNQIVKRINKLQPAVSRSGGSNLIWPTQGIISSPFGMRDGRMHQGLDIANDMYKPIYAALAGEIIFVGPKGSYGNTVIIDHGNGISTLYAHSSQILVEQGDLVKEGQEIAKIGSTGRSTGPHVHFEVRIDGEHKNPINFLSKTRH